MTSYDETHWYGHSGWPRLRGQVVKLAVSLVSSFQERLLAADDGPDEAAEGFVALLVTAIGDIVDRQVSEQLRTSAEDEGVNLSSSLWPFALRLFGDTDPLVRMLVKDAVIVTGRTNRAVSPSAAIGRTVKSFLESARRDLVTQSADKNDSEDGKAKTANRLKNWEAIERVSFDVAARHLGTPIERRCTDEHVEAVFAELRRLYPNSKNLPIRDIETLFEYFDDFCADCEERQDIDYGTELLAARDEIGVWPTVEMCLERLRATDDTLWETLAVRACLQEMNGIDQKRYLAERNISRHRFDTRFREARAFMLACIDQSVSYQLQKLRVS